MQSIRISAFILLLFLSSLSFAAEQTRGLLVVARDQASGAQGVVKLYNKSYAVIIGIDQYKNLPHDRQLRYAVKDAKGMEDLLRARYSFDKIITLYDEEATRDNILRVFMDELPAEMSEEDSLLVFWAGHGNQEKTRTGDIGYLIPHNGIPQKLYTNISMTELKENISKKIPAKHVFYIMDACYSGLLAATRTIDKDPRRDLAYLQEITREPVRQVLTAGGKDQQVLDGGRKGHSVFTGRLIQILEERGDFITANEIQAIIREKVYYDARERNHNQKPDFGILYGNGDFVFIPKIERKLEENREEIARLQEELNRINTAASKAKKAQDARKQREAEDQRKAAEAKLKAEQLKQKQLQEDEARLKRMEDERSRFAEEQKRKERELTKADKEETERLAQLKAEVERRKKDAASVSEGDNIDAAVAEIKSLNRRIDEIESAFRKELNNGKNRIAQRYDQEIAGVRRTLQSLKPLVKDEFETESEYRNRVAKRKAGYEERITELERAKEKELSNLARRVSEEQSMQTADLRSSMKMMAEKEYTLNPEDFVLELGTYDVEKQRFPVSLKSKTVTETITDKKGKKKQVTTTRKPGGILVAVNGVIPLSREEARKFQQEWKSGLVRPVVTALAGSAEIKGIALANDADGGRLIYKSGWFINKSVSEKRFIDLDNISMLDTKTGGVHPKDERFLRLKDGTVFDTRTNLIWAATDNGADINWRNARSYCENYRGGGYSDWRMPTQDELTGLYEANKSYRVNQRDYNVHLTEFIQLSSCCPWMLETRDSEAAYFRFDDGSLYWARQSGDSDGRALPVRLSK